MEQVQSRKKALLELEVLEKPACQHHWLIDRPAGPMSRGVCRICGEERQFQNYLESSAWGYDISLENLSGGSRFPGGIGAVRAFEESTTDEDA